MCALGGDGADRKPVVRSVRVDSNMSLDSFADTRLNDTDSLEVLAFKVLLARLHEEPELGLCLDAHVTNFDLYSHTC